MDNLILTSMKPYYYIVFLLIFNVLTSCNSNLPVPNKLNIVGQWISIDRSDTLRFDGTTGNMYHSCASARNNQFTYQLSEDSITLTYDGIINEDLLPTTHLYYINGDYLSIDFKKIACFGFSRKVINYIRLSNK